jgi:hypothetical protein
LVREKWKFMEEAGVHGKCGFWNNRPSNGLLEDSWFQPSWLFLLERGLNRKRGPGTREKVRSKRINLEGNTHAQEINVSQLPV